MSIDANTIQDEALFWQGKNVFLTGAGGFVGAWLAADLHARGANVVVLIRDRRPDSAFVRLGLAEKVSVVSGSLTDVGLVERILAGYEIQVVFHLAAEALVGVSQKSPTSAFESNIRGSWMLLEACRAIGVAACVVASSDKAYGHHADLPYLEDFPLRPKFPYEVSKTCTDLIAQSYFHSYQVPVGITRCGNIYGGGDVNWSRVIPGTIRSILMGERPIIRSDGSMMRDYLHVDDAVSAYRQLAQALATRREIRGEAFNFGREKPVSVLDLVRTMIELGGRPDLVPDVQGIGKPLPEIQTQFVGCEKARKHLGWAPTVSLEDGIRRSIAWYAEYLKRT